MVYSKYITNWILEWSRLIKTKFIITFCRNVQFSAKLKEIKAYSSDYENNRKRQFPKCKPSIYAPLTLSQIAKHEECLLLYFILDVNYHLTVSTYTSLNLQEHCYKKNLKLKFFNRLSFTVLNLNSHIWCHSNPCWPIGLLNTLFCQHGCTQGANQQSYFP